MTVRYNQLEVQVSSRWANVGSGKTRPASVGIVQSDRRSVELCPGVRKGIALRIITGRAIQTGSAAFRHRFRHTGVRNRRLILMGYRYADRLRVRKFAVAD